MKPRRYFHYLCILLLLVAQHSALAHATWHAAGRAGDDAHAHAAHEHAHDHAHDHAGDHAGDHAHDHNKPAGNGHANLCAFDLTFGQLLGGAHGTCALPIVADLPASIASYVFNPRLGTEAVRALSRGPPPRL